MFWDNDKFKVMIEFESVKVLSFFKFIFEFVLKLRVNIIWKWFFDFWYYIIEVFVCVL